MTIVIAWKKLKCHGQKEFTLSRFASIFANAWILDARATSYKSIFCQRLFPDKLLELVFPLLLKVPSYAEKLNRNDEGCLIHRYTSQDLDWSNKCASLKTLKPMAPFTIPQSCMGTGWILNNLPFIINNLRYWLSYWWPCQLKLIGIFTKD